MMEQPNAAQVSSLYGVSMGEYGGEGVSSMMALMTQHEAQSQGGSGSTMASVTNSYPWLHSTAIFNAERLQQLAFASSSVPFVKTEGCPNLANRVEFHREQAESFFTESPSMQLVNPAHTSVASPHRDAASDPAILSGSRNPTNVGSGDAVKAKILAHPWYPRLLEAYIDCQKVGASQEIVARLDAVRKEYENRRNGTTISVGMDPELDRFMEAYCEMLSKYQLELTKPFNEAMAYFNNIEAQLNSLCKKALRISPSAHNDEKTKVGGSSDEEDCSTGEMDYREADHYSEDKELKDHLLRKYSGYLSGLKQEFTKRKKKGKLPKDARQKLLDWWNLHYKWPYPAESEKLALAESTGLDQKQINNWFINQRKRHWKPSEDMQFVVMDTLSPNGAAALYMERHLMKEGSTFHVDC